MASSMAVMSAQISGMRCAAYSMVPARISQAKRAASSSLEMTAATRATGSLMPAAACRLACRGFSNGRYSRVAGSMVRARRSLKNPLPDLLPVRPLSMSASTQSGTCHSSSISSSVAVLRCAATLCARMSEPARSAVPNVAVTARPMAGPLAASTSSTVRPYSPILFIACTVVNMPMRLATNIGASLQRTTPLPSRRAAKSAKSSTSAASVYLLGMTSSRYMYRGGLKKCAPKNLGLSASGRASAIAFTERPDELVVTMARSLRCSATRAKSAVLTSRFSTTASTTQSTSASRPRSSSKLPAVSSAWRSLWASGAGRALASALRPFSAVSVGGRSSTTVGMPALARLGGHGGAHQACAQHGRLADHHHALASGVCVVCAASGRPASGSMPSPRKRKPTR